jgi:chemotaxis protein MotB
MSSLHANGGDHRGTLRHESLMPTHHDADQESGWMIGYLDIMTLMVALMVLIFTLSHLGRADEAEPAAAFTPLAIPLPSEMAQALPVPAEPRPVPGRLSQSAISAALGVSGPPRRHVVAESLVAQTLPVFSAPTPLALLERDMAPQEPTPPSPLTSPPVLAANAAVPQGDFVLVVTDRPPRDVHEIAPQAIGAAEGLQQALAENLQEAPYLPDLEGVEATRVAEGIKLRVEDQLLFPTAAAELTDDGEALIQRLVEVIQRHEGEVAVEGHTDSRPIQTDEFPSNWVLSSARAIAIVHALERAGVEAQRLRAVGLADTRPLSDNDSVEGRAQNRRVEVIIHAR